MCRWDVTEAGGSQEKGEKCTIECTKQRKFAEKTYKMTSWVWKLGSL